MISALAYVLGLQVSSDIPPWAAVLMIFGAVFFVRLLCAPYWLHRDLLKVNEGIREENLSLKKTIEEEQQPKITGDIEQFTIGKANSGNAAVFVNVTIRNAGAPTIIDKWDAKLDCNGRSYPCRIGIIDKSQLSFDGYVHEIGHEDAIYNKTIAAPIPKGQLVRGWLMLNVDGLLPAAAQAGPIRVDISFEDINRRRYSITGITGAPNVRGPTYYPDGSGRPKITYKSV